MPRTDVEEFIPSLRTPELQKFARIFSRNLLRAEDLRFMYVHLIYESLIQSREIEIVTEVIKERVFPFKDLVGLDHRPTAEFHKEVMRRLVQDQESFVDYLVSGAIKHTEKLTAEKPEFGVWLRTLQQSSAMALWSAFETLVSDMWVYAVNSKPRLFAVRAMQHFNDSLQRRGLSSRSIPVGIAARYDFDLRNHIGDIVADAIDFTSLSDVAKAYDAAFSLDKEGHDLLRNGQLKRLVLIRNLIAHRSGVVDAEFQEKVDMSATVGEDLVIPEEIATQLSVAVTAAGIHLLRVVDNSLSTERAVNAAEPST